MNNENRQAFFEHALKDTSREACALLIVEKGRERLHICENKSQVKDQFLIDPIDFAKAETRGEVIAVVHSHCFIPARASEADKVACEATQLPWFICSVPTGAWYDFKPTGYKAPLIGRTWAHGSLDCFGLLCDYYKETLDIIVPDFDREYEWWERRHDLFRDENTEKAGFFRVAPEEMRQHDALIMQIHSSVPNHCGVYLGDDQFLHQLSKRLSSRDVLSGYYRKHTIKVLRHESKR